MAADPGEALDPRCRDSVRLYAQNVRCDYSAGHAGPHRAVVEWAGTSPTTVRQAEVSHG